MAKDYGYDYVLSLSEAIEKITTDKERKNPHEFIYSEVNLKYSIERAIHSTYADHGSSFDTYSKLKDGILPPKIQVGDDVEKKLLSIMLNIDEGRIDVRSISKQKTFIKSVIRFILTILNSDRLISFVRRKINFLNQRNSEYHVLFYAINERFVKVMKPIFDKTPVPRAFITHDKSTANYLKREGIPYIRISYFAYFINRWSQPESWLKKYCLLEQYDILYDTIKRIRPKSVVLVEGNASSDEVVNQICKKLDIQSICIQQGWSPIIHNGFRNMSYSKMLVWGNGFAELLKPYNPKQSFVVTGNYATDMAEIRKISEIKNIAFFLMTNTRRFTRMLNKYILEKESEFILWTARTYKNINVIIREHPVDRLNEDERKPFKGLLNIKFMNPDEYSLKEVMNISDLSVSIYSSTILESIASGIIPIIFNLTSFPNYFPDVNAERAGIEVKSIEEAKEKLAELVRNPKIISAFAIDMENFQKKYITYSGEKALDNIIHEII